MEAIGRILEALGGVLEALEGILEGSLKRFRSSWKCLGQSFLASRGDVFAASWRRHLGGSWKRFGGSWKRLRGSWRETMLSQDSAKKAQERENVENPGKLKFLGVPRRCLGRFLKASWRLLEASWRPF